MDTYTKTLGNNNRIYWDSVMSSKWAKETEAEIKLLDPAGILVPFIPYRDKVALAKMSNRSLDHAVGTIGNFGFKYRNSDSSKFSLGIVEQFLYEHELKTHLSTNLEMNKTAIEKEISNN